MTDHVTPLSDNCSSLSTIASSNSQESTFQMLCKQILKSRIFRGNYKERRYVDSVNDYRDIVILSRSERDLEKILLDIRQKIHMFYYHKPNMWIGITHGNIFGLPMNVTNLEICIWAELDDIAFGQYWFSIKTVRFRDNEILLKLKMIREVEPEFSDVRNRQKVMVPAAIMPADSSNTLDNSTVAVLSSNPAATTELQIGYNDFLNIIQDWGSSIKFTVYDFMYNDISKESIKSLFKFFGLLVVSLLSALLMGIKYLGIFTLRFMFEISRFTQIASPVLLRLIDVVNKIFGGFYILLAMIWKDTISKRNVNTTQSKIKSIQEAPRNIDMVRRSQNFQQPTYSFKNCK